MPAVGGYTLDLYCDNVKETGDDIHEYKEFPHVYYHQRGEVCRQMARRDGWIIGKEPGRVLCPKCSGKRGRKN